MNANKHEFFNESIIAQYEQDGVVCLRGVFSSHWLDTLARGMEKNLKEPGPYTAGYTAEDESGSFLGDYCNWQRIEEYRRFAFESPAATIAKHLMQSKEVRFYHEHVLVKEPNTREVTPWHHDLPYYGLDGDQVCSIWLPLDPVPKSACPEFITGSHRSGKRYVPRFFVNHEKYATAQAEYELVPDIDRQRDQYCILAWDLEPGDCIVFHMLTLHDAPGTVGIATRRRAFTTRWLGDDAVFATRPWTTSPPFPDLKLKPGEPMHDPLFPVVHCS